MGFAKYHEDIVSRFVNNQYFQGAVEMNYYSVGKKSTYKKSKEKPTMSELKQFAMAEARPLPIIVLADNSGSMEGVDKIGALNAALKEMIDSLAKESRLRADIHVGIVAFGGTVTQHLPLTSAHAIPTLPELKADGATPMGEAFALVHSWLEDKSLIPSRAYRPVIILLSDGQPTDAWEELFKQLCASDRAQKATRLAMAIGADADETMLKQFINDKEAPLFYAHNARDIHRFFKVVTMSVSTRSTSPNPNQAVPIDWSIPDDDLDLDF